MKASAEPINDELLELTLDLRHTKPWHFAEQESIWEVSGTYPGGNGLDSFTQCIARVLPMGVSGTSTPLFEVLVYGDPKVVAPTDITFGQELLLVKCSDPLTAYYAVDQIYIDEALNRRDESR